MRLAWLRPRQKLSTAERPDASMTEGVSGAPVRALQATAIAGVIMYVFLTAKHVLFPNLENWSNRLATSFFVALIVAGFSYSVLRREERHRLEMASSEMRYRLLFWKSLTGAYRTTLDGRILDCNVTFCHMFGYASREEVTGRSAIMAYFNQADRVRFIDRLRAEKELTNFEQRMRRKDGSPVWILISAALVEDEAGAGLVIQGTTTDITNRIDAQQKSRLLADIVRCSHDAIFSMTTEGLIQTWNVSAERIFGYSAAEILGSSVRVLTSDDGVTETDEILETVNDGREVKNRESVRVRKDGQRIAVEITISPTTDSTGTVIGASTIARDVTKKKRQELALRQSEEQYRFLFECNPVPMWVFARSTLCFLAVNSAAIEQYGYSKQEFLTMKIVDIRPEEAIADLLKDSAICTGGLQKRGLWKHRKKNGSMIDAEIVSHRLEFQGIDSILVAAHDVTERKRAQEALLFKTALLEAQTETTIDGILAVDEFDHIVLANKQFGIYFGIPDDLLGARDGLFLRKYFADQVEDPDAFAAKVKYLYNQREEKSTDEVRLKNGKIFDRYSAPLVDATGKYRGRIWYFRDITDRKAAEQRIQFLAYHDALTELPNRALLQDRLQLALADARRRNEKIALLFLDLDRFKAINDSFGHSLGDLALKLVAKRLKDCAREQDTVARVGGDEFLILLHSVKDAADVAIAAERTINAMNASFTIQDHSLNVGCSIGVSMFPDHGADGETLIKNADAAMYFAKENGLGTVRFFTDEMNAQAVQRLTMDKDLRLALDRQEFFLMYQPQMEIESGRITGFEALIRWEHPEKGMISPEEFISIAENDGLILPIGEWVLRTACAQARKWQDDGLPAVAMAVNVSAVQFRQEGFCALIRRVLQETGLSAQYLELELTESLLLSNADVTLSVLHELKEMGLKLSIDDFGTGYSSLNYLKQFSIDKLKIDQSFVRDVAVSCNDAAIANAIISMAKSLHLKVIAEGVENEGQMSFLREHLCDEIQGYYLSRPISAEDAALMLQCAPCRGVAAQLGIASSNSRTVLAF